MKNIIWIVMVLGLLGCGGGGSTPNSTNNSTNIAPVATAQNVSTAEDIPLAITLSGTDEDNDTLTYTIVNVPVHGTFINGTYTPTANYHGTDSFTFKANDSIKDSALATIAITITSVNDAPVAIEQNLTIVQDTNLSIVLTGNDIDGDSLNNFSISVPPTQGILSGIAPNLVYTPNTNYYGTDSFTFQVNDGTLDSNREKINLQITKFTNITVINRHLIIIRIEFNDYNFTNNSNTWHQKIFGTSEGELNHYFNEISYGKFQFSPAVESDGVNNGIITVKLNENHPGILENKLDRFITAIQLADTHIDFSIYDDDKNNAIDNSELQIMFLVAGGERATGASPGVWGHAYSFSSNSPILDGVQLMNTSDNGNYSAFGEKHFNSDTGEDATIGIIAHELGHATFGLPDLYDTSGGSSGGIGNFGLMGGGSWGHRDTESPGTTPVHMTGWSKEFCDFIEFTPLSVDILNQSVLATVNLDYKLYQVPTGRTGEYFLLENRMNLGYDRGLYALNGSGSFDGGLSILHIDDNKKSCIIDNTCNNDASHKLVDIEEANNDEIEEGHYNNLFFSSNNDTFTAPSSNRYNGDMSGVSITNISSQGAIMSFDLEIN